LALLAKESAGGIVAGMPILVIFLRGHSASLERVHPGRLAARFALLVAAVLVAYVLLRWLAGTEAWGGSTSNNAQIVVDPVRWLINGVVLVAPVFYLGSTLDVFPWISPIRLAVSALLTAPLAIVAAMGVWSVWRDRSSRDVQLVVGLALLIGASLVPHALLGHVSETWSTGPLPFASLLLWMLVLRGWRALRIGPAFRVAAVTYLVVAGCWMAFGVREKIDLSAAVAANSRHLFEQAQQVIAQTDGDVTLCVSNEVNANGRRIDRRLAFEQQSGLSPHRLQRDSGRYNVFYDIPSYVLANVALYLEELHPDREVAVLGIVGPMAAKTAESHGCPLLKLLEPTPR